MTDQISAPEFLDLTAFYLAVSSVDKILVQSSESPVPGVDSDLLRKHRGEAGVLIRRVASSVDAGIDSLLRDASEKSKLRVKTKLDAALRGSSFSAYASRAEFLEFFLPRLQTHTNVLRDVFGDKSSQAIRIVQSASVDAPLPRLYKLAGVQMASGGKLPLLKKWIQEATKICGNPVSDIEEISVDIQTTDVLLDRVTKNNRKLDLLDPTDPAAAEVTQENAQLLNKVTRLAEKSGDPASIKAHAAARVAKSGEDKGSFATTISAHLKMTPEQEDSMLARGKVVIAAGAGSGKTRVLAGKVIHHCQDLGLSLSNIMAVSFTIKSSSELKKRIVDYGQEIGLNLPNPDSDRKSFAGIGTTHSIGRRILKSANSGWKTDDPKKDTIQGGDISKLLKVAILQVKMKSQGGASAVPPPSAMSFFPNRPSSSGIHSDPALESTSPIQEPLEGKSPLELFLQDDGRYQTMIAAAVDTIRDLLSSFPSVKVFPASASGWCRAEVYGPGIVRFGDTLADMRVNGASLSYKDADPRYRAPDRFVAFSKREFDRQAVIDDIRNALGFPQAENALQALVELSTKKPSELSANELAILEEIVTNPFVASGLTQRKVLVRTAAVTPLLFKKLAIAEDEDVTSDLLGNMETSEKGIQTASQRKMEKLDYDQSPYYWFIHNPANQWFNIGATDADFQEEDAKGNKKDISVGEFARFVGFNKNSLRAPGEIFMGSQTKSVPVGEDDDDVNWSDTGAAKDRIFSAVYGAYEWLKGNIPTLQGRLDYDDQLVQPSRELIENPELLKKYQKQYKCVLVDEAQDLNAAQHLLFGLVSGYIDPATLKPREDGKISADTFALIGDDKQCVDVNSLVSTIDGLVPAGNLKPGDKVLAYRNGSVVPQTVRHVVPSKWDHGLAITTESGNTLTMSPNHRLWATSPQTEEDQTIVYLMYRGDMGFRVGITNKGKIGSEGDYLNSFGGRCFLEKAEKFWVLDILDREAALLAEIRYSLRFGIPTTVFNGEHRDLNQDRISSIFQEFGKNGMRLLESKHLSFDLPHWMSQSYNKHGRERHTINLLAHCSRSTQVSMEWTGNKFDAALVGFGVSTAPEDRRRIRRRFPNYRDALSFSEEISRLTGAQISYRLSTPEEPLREIPAAGLFVGMSVPILDGEGIVLDKITSITEVPGSFVDLDVDDASNFFAGGILTHNCIYEFRAADPSKFIEKSDLVPGGEGFTTKLLDTNFRSGNVIVESANKLIAYNSKQIPMVCKTDPARGEGTISRMSVPTMDDAAESMCSQILSEFEVAKQDGDAENFYGNYGLAVRTNQEVYQFAMKMIEKGIPFRSKKNFLSGPAIGPVIGIFSILRTDSLEARNAGVIAGLNAPDFGANPNTVNTKMQELGVTDYYDFLVNQNGARKIYKLSKMVSALEQYAEYIEEVVRVGEKGTATDVLDLILNQSGPGGDTFVDSLSASLMDDAEAMEELQAKADADATGSGKITPMMLATYALAPIEPLRKAALRFPTAKEFVGYIRSLIESNKKNVGDGDAKADAVQIDTVHGWKGLEVANLYVPMWDGGFPHKRSMASPSLMESERRLAYVAITRGRERVTILEPKSVKDKDVEPSQFTYEACIPLVGTNNGRGPVGREPGVDDEETPIDLKTASVDRFRIPVMEPRSGSYHQDEDVVSEPVSDDLEKVWDAVPYEGLVK